jgi:hypothetical protein
MKKAVALILFLSLPAVLFAQMTPQYSGYQSLSVNTGMTTGYSTVVVQGTTNPYSQNCYYPCQYGTCQIPNCPSTHTPKILNQYGTIGGWQTGPGYQPNAVINYSTTIAVPLDPVHGSQTKGTGDAQVSCNGCSCLISDFTFNWEFAFTGVVWPGTPPPVCTENPAHCQWTVHNNCTAATSPPDYNLEGKVLGDTPKVATTELSWTVLGLCTRFGTSGPWACSHGFGSWNTGWNVIVPPYSCTHNP